MAKILDIAELEQYQEKTYISLNAHIMGKKGAKYEQAKCPH